MNQPIPTTEFMATLLRLVDEGRSTQARAVWETLIQAQPEVAAQWYLLASLLRDTDKQQQQQIAEGLKKLGDAPQCAFQKTVHTLDTTHRLNHFLLQVKQARSKSSATESTVRDALTHFLQNVQRCKQIKPTEAKPAPCVGSLGAVVDQHHRTERASHA